MRNTSTSLDLSFNDLEMLSSRSHLLCLSHKEIEFGFTLLLDTSKSHGESS